ncbi:tetratricopeptide repeat protein [Streptomyces sp. NPDC056337]|uniref:tetratricopeptide repeat protein n=1 Tax=Streptomyces sp. NPDC056337 TaxID=3345787 RepID=UPI0035E136F4
MKVLHTLLHGLWLGDGLPHRHEQMLGILSRPPFRGRTDALALFREATLLRETRRFAEALTTIDQALELLPPGDPAVHDDLVRERALTLMARDGAATHSPG